MKIVGFQSGHDVSYCILEDGVPIIHEELERFLRLKEPGGDGLELFFKNHKDFSDIKHFAFGNYATRRAHWVKRARFNPFLEEYDEKMKALLKKNDGRYYEVGHHLSHAANAFFTSPFEEAMVITIDGGGNEPRPANTRPIGSEDEHIAVAATLNVGKDNKIEPMIYWRDEKNNFGRLWSNFTGEIFGLSTGYPKGHQAGSVMAMATIGDPKYVDKIDLSMGTDMSQKTREGMISIVNLLREDREAALNVLNSQKPSQSREQIEDWANYLIQRFESTKFEDFDELKRIASLSEQDAFDVAASLQKFTEIEFKKMLDPFMNQHTPKNVCFSGGVSLNCVMLGKFKEWYPFVENIFCDPVPYDGGLSLGSARYVWHHILDNPRIHVPQNRSPYLGATYSKENVLEAIDARSEELVIANVEDDNPVLDILENQQIIAVFGGGSESGRRALGNRSILVDPRSPTMKDTLNERVKHRQWYRPFAPSILKEDAPDWFENFVESPYMSIALKFKEEKQPLVPAVVHADGTGRLQTVDKELNPWYHGFISQWKERTGVPILLNTSFNDREPIVEKPEHAIDCFLRTNIDYLYFFDYKLLLSKPEKE